MDEEKSKVEEAPTEHSSTDSGTSDLAVAAIEYLEDGNPKAFKAVSDYFSLVVDKLKSFDISNDENDINYDLIMQKALQMLPLRNEIISVISCIIKFQDDSKFYTQIHSFFENLLPYFKFRNEADSNDRLAADHYVLFGSELFVYAAAAFLKYQKFEQLNALTSQGYFIPRRHFNFSRQLIAYCKFNQNPETLAGHYRRENVREEDSKTRYFKDRLFEENFHYEELAQADFVLYVISLLDLKSNKERHSDIWYAQLKTDSYPFEIFVRSESAWFFEKFAKCLRSTTKDELIEFFNAYRNEEFGEIYYHLNWNRVISLNSIATRA